MRTRDLPLADARALIARGFDKAEDMGARGALAVVGASGVLVSASRMDNGGAGGMARAISKAWVSATQQIPSLVHLTRMRTLPAPISTGFLACSPEARFPGAGGLPILGEDGMVVAGISASGATVGPFVTVPGIDPRKLIVDGKPANSEDLIVAYALGRPYAGQHGDDNQRWIDAYGALPDEPGLGTQQPPPATRQIEHEWAVGLSDRVIEAATASGVRVAIAIVDHRGDPIQLDTTDHAPTAGPFVAQAIAAAAATFASPSEQVDPSLASVLPYEIATVPGGLPVLEDGRVVAGLGIAGAPAATCREIASAVLAA